MTTLAEVKLWGYTIGAVSLADGAHIASFEYDVQFSQSGIEVAPLMMPLQAARSFRFPELAQASFHGLPGLLADALPDKFGNALIDTWLASQGRTADSFNAIERLCYIGNRGMGALEFTPSLSPKAHTQKKAIEIEQLVNLASQILASRNDLKLSFDSTDNGLQDILRVGTSAGGARAKAVIAWNPNTNEVHSGQIDSESGFEHWLLKFDGVSGNRDAYDNQELNDPQGYGAIEYAYSNMARDAGIEMAECRLFEEGGRRHFMTRRFDRDQQGKKLHMQSLAALAHYDFNLAGAWSYEQALLVMRQLGLPMRQIEQQYRRMVFNVIARNQDDHVKNIAFLMDKAGNWSLSPAYDLTYSYNPKGAWTSQHQMTLNGKCDGFVLNDFKACATGARMKRGRAENILNEVQQVVSQWPDYAEATRVLPAFIQQIGRTLRVSHFA